MIHVTKVSIEMMLEELRPCAIFLFVLIAVVLWKLPHFGRRANHGSMFPGVILLGIKRPRDIWGWRDGW